MGLRSDEIFHMPDLLFARYCEEQFGINKGVYNTIDSWFHQQGLTNIVSRRKIIFNFCKSTFTKGKKEAKFGPGGLTLKLNLFWQQYYQKIEHQAM